MRDDCQAHLKLHFTSPPRASLVETEFTHPDLGKKSIRLQRSEDGFGWSSRVQAFALFFLNRIRDPTGTLEGRRPSVAASINDALTAPPSWLEDMFGVVHREPLIRRIITRVNRDFKQGSSVPVKLTLDESELHHTCIEVYMNNELASRHSIDELVTDIEEHWTGRKGQTLSHETNTQQRPSDNPFNPWMPAAHENFVGRVDLLRRLESAYFDKRSVSIVGDSRIGKSSVLAQWAEEARRVTDAVVVLNGDGPEGQSPQEFVRAVTGLPPSESVEDAANKLARWAKDAAESGASPLVLVDEMEGPIRRFEHRFFERLRGMLGDVAFVFATRRDLDTVYADVRGAPSSLRVAAMSEQLGLLAPNEAEQLIAAGKNLLDESELDLIREWSGNHPFYIQLLGYFLIDGKANDEPTNRAVNRFLVHAYSELRRGWRALNQSDRALLEATKDGQLCMHGRLIRRGLVTKDGTPFGRVLARWIEEEA